MPMFVEAGKQDAIPQTSRVNLAGLTVAVSPSAGDITLHNGLWLYTRDPKTIPLRMDLSSLKALLEGAIALAVPDGFPVHLAKMPNNGGRRVGIHGMAEAAVCGNFFAVKKGKISIMPTNPADGERIRSSDPIVQYPHPLRPRRGESAGGFCHAFFVGVYLFYGTNNTAV